MISQADCQVQPNGLEINCIFIDDSICEVKIKNIDSVIHFIPDKYFIKTLNYEDTIVLNFLFAKYENVDYYMYEWGNDTIYSINQNYSLKLIGIKNVFYELSHSKVLYSNKYGLEPDSARFYKLKTRGIKPQYCSIKIPDDTFYDKLACLIKSNLKKDISELIRNSSKKIIIPVYPSYSKIPQTKVKLY